MIHLARTLSLLRPAVSAAALWGVVLVVAPAARAQGSVLVVHPVNGPYLTVQAAIDAAASGDTVYVHGGSYGRFVLQGHSLTIAAAAGEVVKIATTGTDNVIGSGAQQSFVADIGAAQKVVLRGLEIAGLQLNNAKGAVWIEDCTITTTAPAMVASDCQQFVLSRSRITGPDQSFDPAGYFSMTAGPGALLVNCTTALIDCTVSGGDGKDITSSVFGPIPNSPGFDALALSGGRAWIAGGSYQGGRGGNGGDLGFNCLPGADAGNGLRLASGEPHADVHSSALFIGGAAGAAAPTCLFGVPSPGAPGLPIVTQTGSVSSFTGPARHVAVGGPVVEGDLLQASFSGASFDNVLLLVGSTPGMTILTAHLGALLVPAAPIVLPLGNLGLSGFLRVSMPLPELGPGAQTMQAFVQAVFLPAGSNAVLGGGSVVIGLDAQF